jgi:uncharacterized protein
MNCPICPSTSLLMTDRQGVSIDYCPQCRGVWLDRGELDKLVEMAAAQTPPVVPARGHSRAGAAYPADFQDSDFRGGAAPYGRRKKSWLNEIFD